MATEQTAEPTVPLPCWLNQRDAALSCGISTKSFQEWRVEPIATIGREKFYLVATILANRLAWNAERLAKNGRRR